ncbi:flagellar hook-length control protein FliK [Candidatus Latescibacterota bacterium]
MVMPYNIEIFDALIQDLSNNCEKSEKGDGEIFASLIAQMINGSDNEAEKVVENLTVMSKTPVVREVKPVEITICPPESGEVKDIKLKLKDENQSGIVAQLAIELENGEILYVPVMVDLKELAIDNESVNGPVNGKTPVFTISLDVPAARQIIEQYPEITGKIPIIIKGNDGLESLNGQLETLKNVKLHSDISTEKPDYFNYTQFTGKIEFPSAISSGIKVGEQGDLKETQIPDSGYGNSVSKINAENADIERLPEVNFSSKDIIISKGESAKNSLDLETITVPQSGTVLQGVNYSEEGKAAESGTPVEFSAGKGTVYPQDRTNLRAGNTQISYTIKAVEDTNRIPVYLFENINGSISLKVEVSGNETSDNQILSLLNASASAGENVEVVFTVKADNPAPLPDMAAVAEKFPDSEPVQFPAAENKISEGNVIGTGIEVNNPHESDISHTLVADLPDKVYVESVHNDVSGQSVQYSKSSNQTNFVNHQEFSIEELHLISPDDTSVLTGQKINPVFEDGSPLTPGDTQTDVIDTQATNHPEISQVRVNDTTFEKNHGNENISQTVKDTGTTNLVNAEQSVVSQESNESVNESYTYLHNKTLPTESDVRDLSDYAISYDKNPKGENLQPYYSTENNRITPEKSYEDKSLTINTHKFASVSEQSESQHIHIYPKGDGNRPDNALEVEESSISLNKAIKPAPAARNDHSTGDSQPAYELHVSSISEQELITSKNPEHQLNSEQPTGKAEVLTENIHEPVTNEYKTPLPGSKEQNEPLRISSDQTGYKEIIITETESDYAIKPPPEYGPLHDGKVQNERNQEAELSHISTQMDSRSSAVKNEVVGEDIVDRVEPAPPQIKHMKGADEHSKKHTDNIRIEPEVSQEPYVFNKGQSPDTGFGKEQVVGFDVETSMASESANFSSDTLSHESGQNPQSGSDEALTGINQTVEKTDVSFIKMGNVNTHDTGSSELHNDVIDRIVRHAAIMLGRGQSSAVIKLEPPSLGRLKLEIVTEQSKVTGKIVVETHEVKEIIEHNIHELRENLAKNGLKVESFDVQVGHNGGTDNWSRREEIKWWELPIYRNTGTPTGFSSDETNQAEMKVRHRTSHTGQIDVWI